MYPIRPPSVGLADVPTSHLENLFRRLVRGQLEFPLTKAGLMTMGYNDIAEQGRVLLELDERGVRAVLVAVLAERKKARPRP